MSDIAIRVQNLSKQYTIAALRQRHDTLRDQIMGGLKSVFRRNGQPDSRADTIWALKDISLEVKQGEVIGIIGRNGAGKSTLLKILSRITAPTSGRAELYGRIGSLLEVGIGFDRELSGRENIYLSGAILGMKKTEIDRKFDEIVAFSEVEKFIETPVKRYSSGMYVRLAFAVAAHLDPEILIVDEVLAVGDASFQRKCLGKMGDVAKEGRTVLFVSHNMGAITSLCETALWLEAGSLKQLGPSRALVTEYLAENAIRVSAWTELSSRTRFPTLGEKLTLLALEWLTPPPLRHAEPLRLRIHFEAKTAVQDVSIGVGFSTLEGTRLLSYDTDFPAGRRPIVQPHSKNYVDLQIQNLPLAPGLYSLDIGSRIGDGGTALDYLPNIAHIEVCPGETTPSYLMLPQGLGVRLPAEWTWRDFNGS